MLNNNLFGTFLKEKRLQKGMSLRELADRVGIAHTYLMNIENGVKQPPSDKVLIQLEKALLLDNNNKEFFYELAARIKEQNNESNIYTAADIASYLKKNSQAKLLIRKANELGYSNDFWDELLQKLK